MSYVYSGDSRSLSVTITKYINGVPQVPLTFPTSNDIANGYFTYTGGVVPIPTAQQLAQMTPAEYSSAYEELRLYVQESVPGFLWASLPPGAILVPNIIEDSESCPEAGTPVTTTTTAAPVTTTSTSTSPGTTTTRPPIPDVVLNNATSALSIDAVTIDGVSVTLISPDAFPILPGTTVYGFSTAYGGVYDIVVTVTGTAPGDASIAYQNDVTPGENECLEYGVEDTFENKTISNVDEITILVADVACAPA
jgi:hypothetical protein